MSRGEKGGTREVDRAAQGYEAIVPAGKREETPAERQPIRERLAVASDYFSLMKPRIVALLVITSFCAMIVAGGGWPQGWLLLWTSLGLALSAGGANAINMWYDRDIDAVMERTRHRPIPSGRMEARNALIFGIALEIASILLLLPAAGLLPTIFSTAGFVYYVFIYTMWLKRRTPQNIVIGGAAGAFPPMVGWSAVTGALNVAPLLMFLIIFLWTPPHFWALAISKQEEYRTAGVPMMPVAKDRAARQQSIVYDVLLLAVSVALYFTGYVGRVYLVFAIALGVGFLVHNAFLLREPNGPQSVWARRTFRYSVIYLTVLFAVMVINVR